MKQILPAAVILCTSACSGRAAMPDEVQGFIDNVYELSLNRPDSALTILDRGLADGLISDVDYKYCHASVLYNHAEYAAAASGYEELLDMIGEDDESAEIRMEALKHLSYIRAFGGDYESAVRMCIVGDSLAKAAGNSLMQADFCSNIGFYSQKGDKDEAEKYLQEAIYAYRSLDADKHLNKICQAELYLITVLEEKGCFQKALDVGKDCLEHIGRMENLGFVGRDGIDRYRFNLYSCLTTVYGSLGMEEEARESFARIQDTETYKAFSNDRVMINALMAVRKFSEASEILGNYRASLEAEGPMDSICLNCNYLEVLRLQKECFGALGYADDEKRTGRLLDSLRKESEIDHLNLKIKTLSSSYEVQKKEFELKEANAEIRTVHLKTVFLLVISVLLACIICVYIVFIRIIKAKNAKLSEYVPGPSKPLCIKEADDAMNEEVARFISALKERELYMDSKFNENILLGELDIKGRNFRTDFKAATGKTLPQYLTELRVAKAAGLIRDCPQYTLEYIAEKSGFGSRTTMYRAFTAIYGLSPKEYRLYSKVDEGQAATSADGM